jgi:hypothetical protein
MFWSSVQARLAPYSRRGYPKTVLDLYCCWKQDRTIPTLPRCLTIFVTRGGLAAPSTNGVIRRRPYRAALSRIRADGWWAAPAQSMPLPHNGGVRPTSPLGTHVA